VGPAGFKGEGDIRSTITQSRGKGPRGEPAACGLADNGFIPTRIHIGICITKEISGVYNSVRCSVGYDAIFLAFGKMRICTISVPTPTTTNAIISFTLMLSPKNRIANIGIQISIVPLMMLDSIAVNVRKV